jgi:CBS domain-containing protein
MIVSTILTQKGGSVVSVQPTTSIAEVTHVLAEHRIGAVLVCNERGDLMGILSERDIVAALASDGASVLDHTAEHMMTRHVTTATSRTTVAEAMQMMTHGRFRHLPVLDHGRLIGLVSIGDVVKARMSQQEQEVDSLKAYVSGAA